MECARPDIAATIGVAAIRVLRYVPDQRIEFLTNVSMSGQYYVRQLVTTFDNSLL